LSFVFCFLFFNTCTPPTESMVDSPDHGHNLISFIHSDINLFSGELHSGK
jgi:hypothetical protein